MGHLFKISLRLQQGRALQALHYENADYICRLAQRQSAAVLYQPRPANAANSD